MSKKRKTARTDKERLNWLSKNGLWIEKYGMIGMVFLEAELEDGQSIRAAVDAAMRATEKP